MANYTRSFTTACPADLLASINANDNIGPAVLQIVNVGGGTSIFEFDGDLTSNEVTEFDGVLSSWTCPTPEQDVDGMIVTDGPPEEATDNTLWSSQRVVEFINAEIAAVSAGDPNNVNGKTFGVGFTHNSSSVSNAWLRQDTNDSGMSSDRTPFVLPWACKIISLTYVNAGAHADCDIEIWTAPYGQDPYYNKTCVHTTHVRNSRTVVTTDFGGTVSFSRGDTVAVYLVDQGSNSNHPVVQLTFLITDNTIGNISDNFTNNFSYDD